MRSFLLLSLIVLLVSCDSEPDQPPIDMVDTPATAGCSTPISLFNQGAGRDMISALTDPGFILPEEATYLADEDRVIGIIVDDAAYAIPHNILWYHEIVNLTIGTTDLAVTHCPLTGSSLVFNRDAVGGAEFGVSGLLLNNNLTMFDRTDQESLWPQLSLRAECGPRLGAELSIHPMLDMTWGGWKNLYPGTMVLTNATGFAVQYLGDDYPYGTYREPESEQLLFPMPLDPRRPPKELVLGLADEGRGGIAFPFQQLERGDAIQAIPVSLSSGQSVVFWSLDYRSATAFSTRLNGQSLTFEIDSGVIKDTQSGSTWAINGLATDGPMAGSQLTPVPKAFLSFWFAWAAFYPDAQIWSP